MSSLLKNLEEIDQLLKAQITRGGNSEQKKWAGGTSEDESIPSPAPNGTNYESSKDIAHKAVGDLSTRELELFLNMRKSRPANPRAAEEEILRIPGVSKSICGDCSGVGGDAVNKSMCGTCGGHGIVFDVPNAAAIQMIKSIADKYNLNKGGSSHSGGASGGADPTPSSAEPFEGSKLDANGKKISKKQSEKEDKEEMAKGGKKAKKGGDGLPEFIKEKMDDNDIDDDDDDDDEVEEKSVKKSLNRLSKSMYVLLKSFKELASRQDEMGSILEAVGTNQVNMTKSLFSEPEAARGPKGAYPSQVRVLEKGFPQDAPGGGLRYTRNDIVKAAGAMAIEGKLDPMNVLRLDSGSEVDDKVIKSIEGFLDANGIPDA